MSDRKLLAWRNAGLIDDETVAQIRAWEDQHSRPLAIWAVIGIGALAIGLGLISVVAANWEDVPGTVRLAAHLTVIAGLGMFLFLRGESLERDQPWGLEAGLFVFGLLGMTFFGHIGQVYQTGSPLWKAFAAWLVLFAPLLLQRGQSWLSAALVMFAFAYACWDYSFSFNGRWGQPENVPYLLIALITALPIWLAPFAAWMRGRSTRESFWKRLEQIALVYAVAGASLVCIAAGINSFDSGEMAFGSQAVRGGAALIAGAGVVLARKSRSGQACGIVLACAGTACFVAFAVSGSQLMGGVLFMVLWIGIAAAALYAGWRAVFQIAVGVIALRLIILSFELASDLLSSGAGLIVAGLLILAVAWAAIRISREYAPDRVEAA